MNDFKYALYPSKFGTIKIGYKDNAITEIQLANKDDLIDKSVVSEISDKAFKQIEEYLNGKRKEFNFNYELIGTEFQKSVWKALCDIPYGDTRTYKDIATSVGNPKASRAVGMANNKNPIAMAVPCHRVIGANGKLVGYAGGLDMKSQLLEMESKNK